MDHLDEAEVATYLRRHPAFLVEWLAKNADQDLLESLNWRSKREEDDEIEAEVAELDKNKQEDHTKYRKQLSVPVDLELANLQNVTEDNYDDTLHCEPSPSVVPRTGRKSVTSDLFHQWLASGSGTGGRPNLSASSRSDSQDDEDDEDNDEDNLDGNNDVELLSQNDKLMELILDISNELDINVLCHKILVNVCRLTKADRSSLFLARGPRGKRYLEAKLFDVKVDTSKITFSFATTKSAGGIVTRSNVV
jgi:hypothetical protein